ncbi:DUF2026 family protein [Methylobacter tundripaludum]|nr:DUF2026 family protein [Methylobacter tundripaludum]
MTYTYKTRALNMTPSKTPPVPLRDFERISQSILGILIAENANITASCLFFGIIGESILNRHYKLKARAVVGTAAFNLTGAEAIAFATPEEDFVAIDKTNFHCWVEANGWFLDFSSLVFPEIVASLGHQPCPRLMFQKPLSKSALSLLELQSQGAFYCLPNDMLTLEKIAGFRSLQAYVDLIDICTNWYRKPSKPMAQIGLEDQHGNAKPAFLSSKKFKGVW